MKRQILAALLLAAQLVRAEAPAGTKSASGQVLVPGVNLPLVMAPGQTGSLDITQTDIGQLMDKQMSEYFRRQQEDAAFFKDQLSQLEQMYVRLSNLVMAPGQNGVKSYADLVNDSDIGNFPKSDQFLPVRSQIVSQIQAIRARIGTLRAMNAGTLPSARVALAQGKEVEIPGQLNLNFGPIADYYEKQLTAVGDYLNTKTLSFLDKINNKVDVKGLEFDKSQVHLITEDERKARQNDINKKLADAADAWSAQDKLTREIARNVKELLQLRGADDRGRLTTNSDQAEKDEKVQRLSDALLYHSYLRLKFRQPVGTFYVEYKPLTFNRDQLQYDPINYINKFSDNSVRNRGDVEKSVTSFQRAVLAGGIRQGDGDVFFLSTLLSTWDTLRGWSNLSKLGLQLFKLLYADAREEMAMNTGEGIETYDQTFSQRYLGTPESKTKTLGALCVIDSAIKCPNGKNSSFGGVDANGGYLGLMTTAIKNTQGRLNSISQAQALQRTLDDLINLPQSGFAQKLDDNISILKP